MTREKFTIRPSLEILMKKLLPIVMTLSVQNGSSSILNAQGNRRYESNEPTIRETTDWLGGKTDEIIDLYFLKLSSGETEEYIDDRNSIRADRARLMVDTSTNCSLRWWVEERKTLPNQGIEQQRGKKKGDKTKSTPPGYIVLNSKSIFAPTSVLFSFQDLNPTNVTVLKVNHRSRGLFDVGGEGFDWWVKVYTTNKKRLVKWRAASDDADSNGLVLSFRTEEMAERFAKAIRHAIVLCGGKTDSKEPF